MVQPLVKAKIVKKFGRKFKRYQSDRKIAVKVRGENSFVNRGLERASEKAKGEKDEERVVLRRSSRSVCSCTAATRSFA